MTSAAPHIRDRRLVHFAPQFAGEIAGWVLSAEEQLWLAPSTRGMLTADKVASWCRADGHALVLAQREDGVLRLQAYGEVTPMTGQSAAHWLGHVVVNPACRGCGVGTLFVRLLLRYAFEHLHSRRVSLVVFPANHAAIACYERAGMALAGRECHRLGFPPRREWLLRFEACAPSPSRR